RGSILYFCVAELALVDSMYQYSLSYFLRLFNSCIEQAAKSDDLQQRLSSLLSYMTSSIFVNISRGLFEAHKLQFSFLMCVAILRETGEISDVEWGLLLRDGSSSVDKKTMKQVSDNQMPNPLPDQVNPASWRF